MKLRFAIVALALLTACSNGSQSTTSQGSPAPAPTNSVNFPLYGGSTVMSARQWKQTVTGDTANSQRLVFGQGAGTYTGHEVVAQSTATMSQLESWLSGLRTKPPSGFTPSVTGSVIDRARIHARELGLDFNTFEQMVDGKRHDVVVVAIDPQTLNTKAGPLLGWISKYKMLPQALRDPIDVQARERTGFSVSEALDQNSVIGAALGALDQLQASGNRGILVLDASKL